MKHPPSDCLQFLLVLLALMGIHSPGAAASPWEVSSPNGNVVIRFTLQPDGAPAWQVGYLGKPVVLESRLGFAPAFTNGFQVVAHATAQHSGSWTNAFGERRIVPDNYDELSVDLQPSSGKTMRVTFRGALAMEKLSR